MSLMLASVLAETGNQTLLFWAFVLVGVTVVLMVMELFIPSGGIIGGMAGIAAIGSLAAFFVYDTNIGVIALIAYLIIAPVVIYAMFKFWFNSPYASKLILGGGESVREDPQEALTQAQQARLQRLERLRALIGTEGQTVTPLRPVGVVRINGERIDALAENGAIGDRTRVIVTDVYDNQIKVRPAES